MSAHVRSCVIAVLLCLVAYANALPNGFVYDDWDLVVHNAWLKEGSPFDAFSATYWESSRGGSFYYRPIDSLSYWIDHRLWGERPFGYHLTNVLLHAAATLLVLGLALRWLGGHDAALAAASIFAIHPIHTQSVTWIAGRTDLLTALFFLGALFLQQLAWERASRRDAIASPSRGSGIGAPALQASSLASLALALLSKEMAVTYPAALALHAVLVRRKARRPPYRATSLRTDAPTAIPLRRLAVPLALSLAILAAWFGLRLLVVGWMAGYADDPHAWWRAADGAVPRLLAVPVIVAHYLGRVLFPLWLGFESGIRPVKELDAGWWVSLAGLLALGVLALRFRRKDPAVPLGVAWFLLTLLPVANLFPIFESAMDHFAYLPSVGLIVAGVAFGRNVIPWRGLAVSVCVASVLLFGARTVVRNADWRDEGTFWRVTVRDTPSARAWNNLGLYLKEKGRLEEAGEALLRVAAVEPELASTWANLGVVEAARGNRGSAIALFRRALSIDPTNADALYNLSLIFETNEKGERYGAGFPADEAVESYRALLSAHPDHAEGWTNLGVLFERLGRRDEAERAYSRAIEAAPGLPEPHAFLASLLWSRGEKERAAALYRRYLQMAPDGELAGEARDRAR